MVLSKVSTAEDVADAIAEHLLSDENVEKVAERLESFGVARPGYWSLIARTALSTALDKEKRLDIGRRQQAYADRYFEIHGHQQGEPHTEACVPDPRHPDER